MIDRLRRQLAAPDLPRRLARLAAGAPAAAPLSLSLEFGRGSTDWLHLLPAEAPFWYRARPARDEFRLGIGHALHVASSGPHRFAALDGAYSGFCRDWRYAPNTGQPHAFSGFAFDSGASGPLPNALLAIPAILLESIDGQCRATLSVPAARLAQATAEWAQLLARPARPAGGKLLPRPAAGLPERAWLARVQAALRDIDAGRVAKLVLGRGVRLESTHALAPAALLANLARQQPASLIYAHGHGPLSFLGATPERLVRLHDGLAAADALAGTAWNGSLALAEDKNRHEQSLVVDAVLAALAPLCAVPPRAEAPAEHAAGHLTHWRSQVSGRIKPSTTLFDLVHALHPTPAVGGYPSAAAQAWLTRHGEQRAGWYSGGFGLLTAAGEGEFSVALRSALLHGRFAELQAGAGIVAGSIAEQELAETEAKLGTLLAALGEAPADIRNNAA